MATPIASPATPKVAQPASDNYSKMDLCATPRVIATQPTGSTPEELKLTPTVAQGPSDNNNMILCTDPQNLIIKPTELTPEEFELSLNVRLATDMMMDRALKPQKQRFRFNDLPPRSPIDRITPNPIDDLQAIYRRSIFDKFKRIEETFGPDVCKYPRITAIIDRFRGDCKATELMCATAIQGSETLTRGRLEKLYIDFQKHLDMFYDGLLSNEQEARFDVRMKKLQINRSSTIFPFFYKEGQLHRFRINPHNPDGKFIVEHIRLIPIPEFNIRRRLLREALARDPGSADKFNIFKILVYEVNRKAKNNTLQLAQMIAALKTRYRGGGLKELGGNIYKMAQTIYRRFGYDFFFSEDQPFREMLPYWVQRYCKVADEAWEKSMVSRVWAQEVKKVLYFLLEFLKVSHDALLEREINEKVDGTIELLRNDHLIVAPPPANFKYCVRDGSPDLIPDIGHNAIEKLETLMDDNEIAAALGESAGNLVITRRDLALPANRILLTSETEADSCESESEDDPFPPIKDDLIHPVWNTRPGKGSCTKSRSNFVLFDFPILPKSPPQSPSSSRVFASTPGSSKKARTTTIHRSSPISSPTPATPGSKMRLQVGPKKKQDNSKNSPTSTIDTPAIDQNIRRPPNISNKGYEKPDSEGDEMEGQRAKQQNGHNASEEQPGTQTGSVNGSATRRSARINRRSIPNVAGDSENIDPDSRTYVGQPSAYLGDPNISATRSMSTAQRPGQPFFPPPFNSAEHLRNTARPHELEAQRQAALQQQRDIVAHIQAHGPLAAQQAYQLAQPIPQPFQQPPQPAQHPPRPPQLGSQYLDPVNKELHARFLQQFVVKSFDEFVNKYPRWETDVTGDGVPFEEGWSSKPMPLAEDFETQEDWSIEKSDKRANGYKLTDKEFEDEIEGFFD